MRWRAKPAKAKVDGKRPPVRKSPKPDDARVQDLEKRLAEAVKREAEAREQQTATAEILRVISNSPSDYQRVFDTIVRNAGVVCGAADAILWTVEGDEVVVQAHHGPLPARIGARQPIRGSVAGYAVHEARVIHIEDVTAADDFPVGRDIARRLGWRTVLSAPLLRAGLPIGAILIRRREVRPFTEGQIALLQTFADQAVIAIENVRLFNETKEALDRQTATSEILNVISRSPTDVQPVFDAIVRSAVTLCGAILGAIYRRDGGLVRLVGLDPRYPHADEVRAAYPAPVTSTLMSCRAIHENAIIQLPDTETPGVLPAEGLRLARLSGFRSVVAVPMRREGEPIGAILIGRPAVGAFPDEQIGLLQAFADQAVIAIENVRLFKELEASNRDLTVSLDQQTATSEILRSIAHAKTDVQPVFDAMVRSARRLCDATYSAVYRLDGDVVHLVAHNHHKPDAVDEIGRAWPIPLTSPDSVVVWAIREQTAIHTEDVQAHLDFPSAALARARALDLRSMLVIPMVREGNPIGAIRVSRTEPTRFSDKQVALLQTFANQAVIAIENVRLFKELQGANRELSAASQHKSEFLANMSHELRTPLNAVIGFSEVLIQRMFGDLNPKQDEYLKDIYASGQHLLSLINDILDLSKIEAGRMELTPAPFHLPSAVENAVTLVRERAARHGIALHLDLDPALGEFVGDERKIKQVLLNLLSNAVKFTPEGGRISVKAGLTDGVVEIAVTDTGIGIAPEDQGAIFEEFRQVGTDETRKQEGTGLGLTLAKKFIELHGGRIWVESALGQGSTFTFTLPVS